MRAFITGADAIARAALRAGCNFFAGYPITPATPILQRMLDELPKVGGVAIQAEDEMAALGMCIGAVMAGCRAMTATSGPGISLFSENIGAAIMLEAPLVIVDVQRMGPATGGATTTAQGDVQFLRWGTSGGYPVIVLCPTDISECYKLTQRAFDLAEGFRLPVFLALDKHMVMDSVTLEVESFEDQPVRGPSIAPTESTYSPYRFEPAGDVPAMAHFGGPHLVRATTSSHDERGYLIKDPVEMERLNRHLTAKIEDHADEIALVRTDLEAGAQTLVVSYGITAGAMDEAVGTARRIGVKVSAVTVYSLWPVPERKIRAALEGVRRVIVPELNQGQYRREIERLAKNGQEVVGVNRVDGELITPQEILEKLTPTRTHEGIR